MQASGSNRASAAYETAEDASPHACIFGPQPAIRTQKPLFLRQRGMPRFPSVGVETLGRSPGFDPRPARSQHAMQTTTPRSPSFVGQGGWIRSSGLRLPTPALFQLSYTLSIETPCSRRTRRRTATSQTCPACETGMRRPWRFHPGRNNRCAPGCCAAAPRGGRDELGAARRSSLAGSAKWTRTTIERINGALPCLSAIAECSEDWLTRLDLNQDLTV